MDADTGADPAESETPTQLLERLSAFRPVAEKAIGQPLDADAFHHLLLSLGLERLVEDVVEPVERAAVWDTLLASVWHDPSAFAAFLLESWKAWEKQEATEQWSRYIG